MSSYIGGNGVNYSRSYQPPRAASTVIVRPQLAFTRVHEYMPAFQGTSSLCGFCFCACDDWRHLTPIRAEDRLFS